MIHNAFISSSFHDKEFVFELFNTLQRANITSYIDFIYNETIQHWEDTFLDRIKTSKVFVSIISENYINSECAMVEWGAAFALGKPIISIVIGNVSLPFNIGISHQLDFTDSKDASRDLVDIINRIK